MANRFTDSTKWNKPFIRAMKAPYKLLWLYILDECDHAGIWQVDFTVAQVKIGEKLNQETAVKSFENKIVEIDGGEKWFIRDFIDFQYKDLNPENRVHNSVIKILSKYNLLDAALKIKPLTSPLQGAKDMDKEKDSRPEIFIGEFQTAVNDFIEMRVKAKKAPTKRAMELVMIELEKLAPGNETLKIEILNQSVKKGWTDVYPLNEKNQNVHTKPISTVERIGKNSKAEFAKFIENGKRIDAMVEDRQANT